MNFEEREIKLFQILSIRHLIAIDKSLYLFFQPSLELKHEAERFYADLFYQLSFDDWLTKDDIETVLINLGLWDRSQYIRIKQLEDQIQNFKVDIYQASFKSKKKDQIRKTLRRYQKSVNKLQDKLAIYDHVTLDHYFKTLKLQYIIALSIYDNEEKPVYNKKTLMDSDNYLINKVLSFLSENRLGHGMLREIARTDPWRSYWNIGKEKAFNTEIANLTDEQRTLALFSRMYDNAYANPDCPDEDIVNDDDAFDGWMILQDRERKKNISQKGVDNIMSKHKQASEIFIPVDNVEDAKKIKAMNSIESQIDMKIREKVLESGRKIDEIDLPDVRKNLRQQMTQEFVSKVKRG